MDDDSSNDLDNQSYSTGQAADDLHRDAPLRYDDEIETAELEAAQYTEPCLGRTRQATAF